MASTASTSIANSNTPTASRRSSWKNEQDKEASTEEFTCEKSSPYDNMSASHDHDHYGTLPHSTDAQKQSNASSTKPHSKPSENADIEAQHGLGRFNKVSWKYRVVAYIILAAVIFIWLLLILAVLVLTDNFFPGALRSYHMLKDLSIELSSARLEIAGLKAQMATLYQSVGRWGSLQKVIGEQPI